MARLSFLPRLVSPHVQDPGLRLFLSNLWQNRRLFALTLLFSFLAAVFEGFGIGLLVPFLNGLMDPDSTALRTGWQWFDRWVLATEAGPVRRLYQISTLILTAIWLRVSFGYLSSWFGLSIRESFAHQLRCRVIDQLQDVALSYFSKKRAGDFLNNLTSQVSRLRHLFDAGVRFVQQTLLFVVYLSAIIWLSWELALFAIIFCSLLFLGLNSLIRRLRKRGQEIYDSDGDVTSIASEIVNGIRTIASFGTKEYESNRFKTASQRSRQAQVSAGRRGNLVGPLSQGMASTGLIVLVIVAVHFFVMTDRMSAAALLTFFFALFRLLPLVQMINETRSQWAVSRSALDEFAAILRQDDKPYLIDGHVPLTSLQEGFKIKDVAFGYEPGQTVLDNISTRVERGKTTAIVGGSGAGKTTLADLIARLHEPNSGRILLDGRDLHEYTIKSLRQKIAIVNQNTFLFHDTVTSNIAYGLDDIPMEKIRWAAEKANAIDFIEAMEDGFDTVLGDRGERLSGGQRQRISIARALLRDPEILILDEATSALDSVTERLVQDSLEFLMEGRTVVVIAHRLSTIENADNVLVLEDGKVIEQGTYDELLSRKGQFWKYHSMQYQVA
jgi:subfamily B ATP-binding cassette protein MsbA